jgi:hypothetical protein
VLGTPEGAVAGDEVTKQPTKVSGFLNVVLSHVYSCVFIEKVLFNCRHLRQLLPLLQVVV